MERLASSGNAVLQHCLSAFMECDSVIYLIGEGGGEGGESGGADHVNRQDDIVE